MRFNAVIFESPEGEISLLAAGHDTTEVRRFYKEQALEKRPGRLMLMDVARRKVVSESPAPVAEPAPEPTPKKRGRPSKASKE